MPRVLNKNIHETTDNCVYVGRPGKYGNPYFVGTHGSREQVLEKYRQYLYDTGLADDVEELRGKDLFCSCAPDPCHADVLLKLANR